MPSMNQGDGTEAIRQLGYYFHGSLPECSRLGSWLTANSSSSIRATYAQAYAQGGHAEIRVLDLSLPTSETGPKHIKNNTKLSPSASRQQSVLP